MAIPQDNSTPTPPVTPTVDDTERDATRAGERRPDAGKSVREVGGPAGLEPTRYGDWEVGGRCSDF